MPVDQEVIGDNGVTKEDYPLPAARVIEALRVRLCPDNQRPFTDVKFGQGRKLTCSSYETPRGWFAVFTKTILFPFYDDEAAEPWAHVIPRGPSQSDVTIGVKLWSDDKRVKKAREHSFPASKWVGHVWAALDRLAPPPAGAR